MCAKFGVGADFPDVRVDPVVEQAGRGEEGKNKLITNIDVLASDERPQSEAGYRIEDHGVN